MKFLEVDKDQMRRKLEAVGATLLQPETLMRRTVFETGGRSFARVRDEGDKITMSYKRLDDLSLSGMKEVCLTVNSYDGAVTFLEALGLDIKAEQETWREEWLLDDVEIDIDTWPWLPTTLELDGPSEVAVKSVAEKLGLPASTAMFGSIDEVYKLYYDVTSEDVNQKWAAITFGDGTVPDWLEAKRLRKSIQELK